MTRAAKHERLPESVARQTGLAAMICERAETLPQQTAVVVGNREMDYASLLRTAQGLVAALRLQGVQSGDVVAFTAQRDAQTLQLMLAVLLAGGACLPLDIQYPPARLGMMLGDARPRVLVAPADMREQFAHGCETSFLAREQLFACARDQDSACPGAQEGRLAYVLFTSGSSGRPKGVAMRSRALAQLMAWHGAHPRLGRPARTLQFAPLSFDVCFQEIHSTLATGGTLVVSDEATRRDPFALLELLARERVERVFLPYVALQALAEAMVAGGVVPTQLRDVISAGEQLRVTPAIRALFAAVPGCVLHNQYGPTETHVVTAHELHGDPEQWPDLPPIGHALAHVQVRVVDTQLHDLPAGEEGELLLGGDCLAEGYIGQPERTAERFIQVDGARWYRTGDGVRDLGDGVLEYLGRLDAQIKMDGYRVEPGEIESILTRHSSVAEAVVVVAGEGSDRRLVAHVVPRDPVIDDDELCAQLLAHCQARLAAYLVPQGVIVRSILPLTASGKIDRRALARNKIDATWTWPTSATLHEQLAGLWGHLLGLDGIDPQANLFDLGARSLTVVRALTELRGQGFRTLSAAQIYEHSSVARQVALLQGDARDEMVAGVDTRLRGDRQRTALARFGPRTGRRA
jgi:amino acid adenylation domain-containing protein